MLAPLDKQQSDGGWHSSVRPGRASANQPGANQWPALDNQPGGCDRRAGTRSRGLRQGRVEPSVRVAVQRRSRRAARRGGSRAVGARGVHARSRRRLHRRTGARSPCAPGSPRGGARCALRVLDRPQPALSRRTRAGEWMVLARAGAIVKCCGSWPDRNQAATLSSVVGSSSVTRMPSLNFTSASTSATSSWPLKRRQRSCAASSSL